MSLVNCASRVPFGYVVSCLRSPPSDARIVYRPSVSLGCGPHPAQASRFPFGDQAWHDSDGPGGVITLNPDPSGFRVAVRMKRPRWIVTAILVPSSDQVALSEAPAKSRCSPVPSGLIVKVW